MIVNVLLKEIYIHNTFDKIITNISILYICFLSEPQSATETIPETTQTTTPKSTDKPKVVVQQVGRVTNATEDDTQKMNIANGQQPSSQSVKEGSDSSPNKFILTPDYIQQS